MARSRTADETPAGRVCFLPYAGGRRRHVYAALRLRRPLAQHTEAEAQLLARHARGATCVVELGVAEGASAWQMLQTIDSSGRLYLVDPYVPRNFLGVSMARIVARRLVGSVDRGSVVWIRQLSHLAAEGWGEPIDFLFIDADHSMDAVQRDWDLWTPHVRVGGTVALHGGIHCPAVGTLPDDAPIRFAEQLKLEGGEWRYVEGIDSTPVFRRETLPRSDKEGEEVAS